MHHLLDARGLQESRSGQGHPHRQHIADVETGIDSPERDGRADEECRTDEEDQRERDLDDDEKRPRLVLTESSARPAGAFLHGGGEVGTRALNRRNQAEEHARAERDRQREEQDAPVHADEPALLADARKTSSIDAEQSADPDDPEDRPEHAAGERQHHALGQQLPHDPAAAGPDGGTHGNLTPPARGADEQQVGDVGTGDEQHEADGADEHQQRRANVADERFTDRQRLEHGVLAECFGKLLVVLGRGELQPRIGLFEGDARRQAPGDSEVVPLILRVGVELERDPDFGIRDELLKVHARVEHANHRVRIAAERDGLADDVGIAVEASRPHLIAEHDGLVAVGPILFSAERASPEDWRAEEPEEICRDAARSELFGKRSAGVVDDAGVERGDVA